MRRLNIIVIYFVFSVLLILFQYLCSVVSLLFCHSASRQLRITTHQSAIAQLARERDGLKSVGSALDDIVGVARNSLASLHRQRDIFQGTCHSK